MSTRSASDGLTGGDPRRLLDIARSVLSDLEPERVLRRVLAAAQELSGARYAALGVIDESGTALEHFLTAGVDEEATHAIGARPKGRGVLGELIVNPVPLRLPDIGAHPRSYGFPFGHPRMRSFLGVPVLVGGRPFGNLYLADKRDADEFDADDEAALVLLAEFAGVAIDHARRYRDVETRHMELQRTVHALDATLQIARALGGESDLDAILQLVAKRGRALVSARALVIEYLRDGELVVVAAAGELPGSLVGARLDLQDSVAGAALRSQQTQRLDLEPNRRRFRQYGLGSLGISAEAGMVVPLVFRGRGLGVLVAADHLGEGTAFDAEAQRLLEAFASSAATAIAGADATSAERRSQRLAAAEEERGRWARELHDETLQGMSALRLRLSTALRGDGLDSAVREVIDQLDADIAGLRTLITELRPAALDQLGPGAALEALADGHRRDGLEVITSLQLAYEDERASTRHAPEIEIAIYRIVQESLTNAGKHGGARRVDIAVEDDDVTVRVTVRDDGCGFDPTARTDGFGLLSMRDRVTLLDGTLDVVSQPGSGTTVAATLPARRRAA